MKDLSAYLAEAIENIRKDREVTKELLDDVMQLAQLYIKEKVRLGISDCQKEIKTIYLI